MSQLHEYGGFSYRARGTTFLNGLPIWEILDGERIITTYVGLRQALHDFIDQQAAPKQDGEDQPPTIGKVS